MKNVLLITGLAVLSTSAFASKARLEALGASSIYYIGDSRSAFLNPADLNGVKNVLVTEWGTANAADTDGAPRAEGGFFREMGTFTYGLYLGNNTVQPTRAAGFLSQDNAIDLLLAGDMGAKWGARLHYANSKDESGAAAAAKKNSALGLSLGGKHGDMSAYVNMTLTDKSTGNGTVATYESKMKPSYQIGGAYDWSGFSFYADYSSSKLEQVQAATTSTKDSEIILGVGRTHEINPTARVFSNAQLSLATNEEVATTTVKTKTQKLPVTLGMEADATSWLVVRGSVSQNFVIGQIDIDGKKRTIADSTSVNAGATLNFGKLKVDGMVGNTGVARNAATPVNQGVLSTDNLLTRVGVSYAF
jgi:hypothetical protein